MQYAQTPAMKCASLSVEALSLMSECAFVAALDGVFEHSPWVAQRAWETRPFADDDALAQALVSAMMAASREEQLALIRAHPELAGKAALAGELTAESTSEQAKARLDACSPEEFARLHDLNAAYNARFGFPFILAVRGLDRVQIIETFAARLGNAPEREFAEALHQIARIAAFRLRERLQSRA